MPTLTKDLPKTIQPYVFHGVDLDYKEGEEDSIGCCPFCGREKKFSVNVATGMYRCFICAEGTKRGGGNIYVFLRHFWELCRVSTKGLADLAQERGLLDPKTLEHWGVVRSVLTNEWLVPGHSPDGKMNQLYKYVRTRDRKLFMPTPTLHHQVHGVPLYDKLKPMVFVCEGPFDAMALWEVMGRTRDSEEGMRSTSNVSSSLLSESNVVAVPNCGAVGEPFTKWLPLFEGKVVNLLFDNDHDVKDEKTGNMRTGGGFVAVKRAAAILAHHSSPPQMINWFRWTNEGVFDPSRPDGHDVRDMLNAPELNDRIEQLSGLLKQLDVVPEAWVKEGGIGAKKKHVVQIGIKHCTDWRVVTNAWRKAFKYTDGLDHGLCTVFACGVSVDQPGDQIWVKLMGPPATGKTTVAEGFETAKAHVVSKDTFNGFLSGYQDETAEENYSLAPKLNGKMFFTKDGDTLLQNPRLPEILSQGRALYDGSLRANYNNKMSADHEEHRMVWVLCGTSSLRVLDQSELGERFLDCVMMDTIDLELEDEIQWRVANRVNRNLGSESTASGKVNADVDMAEAMALTGGYLTYLKENASDLLSQIHFDQDRLRKVCHYARFVAYMRARPSIRQVETAEREFSTRLTSQLVRMAKCMAVVLNKTEVDDEVLRRVLRLAKDTARGITLEMAKKLHEQNETGMVPETLGLFVGKDKQEVYRLLKFLRQIGAVYPYEPEIAPGVKGAVHWRLTDAVYHLYNEVML